jgi:hypothetical protein
MSYCYEKEKPALFTEDGVTTLMAMRDKARELLKVSGAVRADKIIAAGSGDSWTMLAALDYLVEKGELQRVATQKATWAQLEIFVSGNENS